MKETNNQTLKGLLDEMLGDGTVRVEVIEVPAGSTIEEELAKRRDPNWCEDCGEVHSDDAAAGIASEDRRQKALVAVRERQARLLKALDILKQLEASIAKPKDARDSRDTLAEVIMMLKLKALGQ